MGWEILEFVVSDGNFTHDIVIKLGGEHFLVTKQDYFKLMEILVIRHTDEVF